MLWIEFKTREGNHVGFAAESVSYIDDIVIQFKDGSSIGISENELGYSPRYAFSMALKYDAAHGPCGALDLRDFAPDTKLEKLIASELKFRNPPARNKNNA